MNRARFLISLMQSDGLWSLISRAAKRALRQVYHDKTLVVFGHDVGGQSSAPSEHNDVHYARIAGEQGMHLLDLVDNPNRREDWQRTLAADDVCFVGHTQDGRPVTFAWFSLNEPMPDDFAGETPVSKWAYFQAAYTVSEMRRRGLARGCLAFACQWLASMGISHIWFRVNAENRPSLRCYEGAGCKVLGYERTIRVFGLPVHGRTTTVPSDGGSGVETPSAGTEVSA